MSIILLQIIEMITFKKFNSEGVFQGINRPCKLSKKKKTFHSMRLDKQVMRLTKNLIIKKIKSRKTMFLEDMAVHT